MAHAAALVARTEVAIRGLVADRDAFLLTLRGLAPGPPPGPPAPPHDLPPGPMPAGWGPPPSGRPAPLPGPPATGPPGRPGPVRAAAAPSPARRQVSPQQVLVGLGALLVVAASIAFVAVAWTRLGLGFQIAVMSAVTAAACGASAWTARRGLRATEEALAATGVGLLVVDLVAARALGLFGSDEVPVRLWSAGSCLVVVTVALLLARPTRSTATWPLAALLAAQPVPFLLLPADWAAGPAGVAAALVLAAVDLTVAGRLRRGLRPVALVLAALQAAAGVLGGLVVADGPDAVESWTATVLLAAAGGAAVALARRGTLPRPVGTAVTASAVAGLALALSLRTLGTPGPVVAAGMGLGALTAAVLLDARRPAGAAAWSGGATLAAVGGLLLADAQRWAPLAGIALLAVATASLAAVRRPDLRSPAVGTALGVAAAAVLLARAADLLPVTTAGLALAVVAALGFGVAALRPGRPEEPVAAVAATLTGATAAAVTGTVGAWGQVGLQLALVGAAAAGYAMATGRRAVAVLAVADLVLAGWIALAGADVRTPEAYTLPAAAGLLVVALPRIRAGSRSWSGEGPGSLVALVPSSVVAVSEPTALRLVLVVAAGAVLTVVGARVHRQAPFVVGAGALLVVVLGRLGPYAPLLPRWLALGAAGLLLLVVGATYERRRQQAREAVAWVGQMR